MLLNIKSFRTVLSLGTLLALALPLPAADVTFYSFGDSHYGATGGGETNWVKRINGMAQMTLPAVIGGGLAGPARGVLALGDLINDGGSSTIGPVQWAAWKADYGVTNEGVCIYPMFENFGNHDLNASRFVQKDIIERNKVRPGLTAVSPNGLHYSWDWDGVHFVALGIYPADFWTPENTYGSVHDPEYALSFLKWDLENNVGDSGRPVITMHHYDFLTDWWPSWQKLEYPRILEGYNVILILHGHQGAPYSYDWQGYTVSGQNGSLNYGHITPDNRLLLAQNTGTNAWGSTYAKSITFPDLGLSWNGLPKNGNRNVEINVTQLSWRRGSYVVSQDVYFGTSSNTVFAATVPDIAGLAAGVTNVTLPAAFLPLQPGTEYFWRVDQNNGAQPNSKGRVWSFRTKDVAKTNDLTFLFVSDIHYEDITLLANQKNVQAMNRISGTAYPPALGGVVETPRGVVFGGDAANDAALWQYRFYTNDYGLTGEKMLQYPVAGENNGNHDGGLGAIVGDSIVLRNRTRAGLTGISTNGLHISWDWDGVHFVTLGVRPGTNASPYNSHGALEFLMDDLPKNVGNSGRPVVLTQHFGVDDYANSWWTDAERERYYNVIKDYNVVGIFHGHTHVPEIYKWKNIDVFHPPHMQFAGSVSVTVTSSEGFFVVQIKTNRMAVLERRADGTWGTNLVKTIYRSYPDAGLAAVVNDAAGAANVKAISATLNGKLVYAAANPTFGYIFYGTANGGTNKAAWQNVAVLGERGLGAFSAEIADLASGTTYYYRSYASNALGEAWSDVGTTFTTLPPAIVDNASGASGIRMATATLNGTLTLTGSVPTQVYIYYGATDGGTSKAAWANELPLGERPLGAFSQAIAGLAAETTYYYRCYASNNLGGRFASATTNFITQPPVAVDNALGASNIGDVSATLNGTVLITNAVPTYVYIYWGTNDGGTVRANWNNEAALGQCGLGAFSTAIGGLKAETRYYYRCYATNSAGARWAAATSIFDSARDFSPWQNRMKITFKGYNRSEALVNFPVLVALNESITNFSYGQFASPNGADLRFATASNSELKFEVDEWNPGGTSYFWVQVPVLADANTYIWAYWGNPAETKFPAYTTNGAAWSEGFAGVWHMSEPNALDALNLNNGTSQGGTNAPGLIGVAQGMPGTADKSVIVNTVRTNLDITGNLSVGGWMYVNSTASVGFMAKGSGWGDYNIHTKGGTGNVASFELKPFCGDGATAPVGTTSLQVGKWYHVYGTWDGTYARIFVNGKEEASKTTSGTINNTSPHVLRLGTLNDRFLNGYLDEVSISAVSRSSNWVWASYMSQGSNAVFTGYTVITSAPPAAVVSHLNGATAVTVSTATLNGNLSSLAASPTFAFVCWGTADGGTVKSSWQNTIALGATAAGTFATNLSGLTGGTTYYYRCFASNAVGTAWAPASSSFFTLTGEPTVANSPATGITHTSASLNGDLISAGLAPASVYVYWGASDGGTDKQAWASQVALGVRDAGAFSTPITGLVPGTPLFFRCYASNLYGGSWAPSAATFQTAVPAEINNAAGATGILTNQATLNGNLVCKAVDPTEVWVYWGTADGGKGKAAWANAVALGARPLGAFSAQITGLTPGLTCYYRTYASNAVGQAWAATSASFVVPGGGPFSGWSHNLRVTFSGYNRTETLANFPALISLAPGVGGFDYSQVALPAGGDLRFADALGNELSYEIDEWNPGGTSYVWVKVPALQSSETYITAYWGNSSASPAPAYTTDGSTWANGYAAVWHLGEANAYDSLNRNNATSQGSTNTPGPLGIAQAFTRTSDTSVYVPATTAHLDITGNLSIEGWVKPLARTNHLGIAVKGATWGDYNLFVRSSGKSSMELKPFMSGAAAPDSTTTLALNTWYYVHGTWDGSSAKMYLNGVLETTKAATGTIQNSSHSFKIGTIETRYTASYIDEVRVSNVARSANWVWACWMNSASNAQFCTYSSAPANPDADADGLPDAWEMAQFGNTTTADATSDYDHDGMSDLYEYRAGTSPTNSASLFAFTSVLNGPNAGTAVLNWQSVSGKLYSIQQRDLLTTGLWQTIASNLVATPPINSYTTAPITGTRFFRLGTE